MTIKFFIDELRSGGAEGQMLVLAESLLKRGHKVSIVTFYPTGANYQRAQNILGLNLDSFWKTKSANKLVSLIRHRQGTKKLMTALESSTRVTSEQNVIYSFLEWPNVLAFEAAKNVKDIHIVWGVRGADDKLSRWRQIAFKRGKRVSKRVDLIIANSDRGKIFHLEAGFDPKAWAVVENGIEFDRFLTNKQEISSFEREWGIDDDDIVISVVGRLVEVKDHTTFLNAVSMLKERSRPLKVFCAGDSEDSSYEHTLRQQSEELGLREKVTWMGQSEEVAQLLTRSQLSVLPSLSEGFPNVVCESMMCGTPVVSTDVGDARKIVSKLGLIVPVGDPQSMAIAIDSILDNPEKYPAEELRRSIADRFSVDAMTDRTIAEIINIGKNE